MFVYRAVYTAQKMKFSIKDFFSKCDQILRKRHLLCSDMHLSKLCSQNSRLFLMEFKKKQKKTEQMFNINLARGLLKKISTLYHTWNLLNTLS